MNLRLIMGIMVLLVGCTQASQTREKGKGMRDQIEKLLTAYSDLYASPNPARLDELEAKVAGLEFDGIHIGTPDSVDASKHGIPLLSLSGNSLLRGWEVEQRTNAVIVAVGMDAGKARFWPLYPPPAKKLKPMPRPAKPTGEAALAREYGSLHRVVGENTTGGLPAGDYAISILEWDRASNIRTVRVFEKPGAPLANRPEGDLPWDLWKTELSDFQRDPRSPELGGDTGLTAIVVGAGAEARILGSFGVNARKCHVIGAKAAPDIQVNDIRAAIPLEVLQLILGKATPELNRIIVPIHYPKAVAPGDILKGWFTLPLAKLRKPEATLIYLFVDGLRSGPVPIPSISSF